MTARTAWIGGAANNAVTFYPAFSSSDFTSLANLASVLSTVATFDNTVNLDQFMDISFTGAIAAPSTIASGAGLAFFLWTVQLDNTTLGDARLTPGTQVPNTTYSPLLNPLGGIPISAGSSVTTIAGSVLGITLPPRAFRLVMQNQTGFALAASGCACSIATYRQNTNA